MFLVYMYLFNAFIYLWGRISLCSMGWPKFAIFLVSFLSRGWVCATILLSVIFLYLFQREIGKGQGFGKYLHLFCMRHSVWMFLFKTLWSVDDWEFCQLLSVCVSIIHRTSEITIGWVQRPTWPNISWISVKNINDPTSISPCFN